MMMFGESYKEKVLSIEPDSSIGFWLQDEASGSVAYDSSGQGNDGAYTGVTLGQAGVPGMGYTSPLFDGANDYNNIYSVGLNADFGRAEGALLVWAKVSGAGVWTDGTPRYPVFLRADASNQVYVRFTGANAVWVQHAAGGVALTAGSGALATTDFFSIGATWSTALDEFRLFIDGVQDGATQNGLGTWVGNLAAAATVVGASNTVPASVFSGNLGPVALWNKALTPDQVAHLSKV